MTVVNSWSATGTTAYAGATPPSKRFLASVVLAGAAATGTLPVLSVADILAMRNVEVASRTLPAAPSLPRVGERTADVSARLQRLRRLSDLTWGEIAVAVGVTRRSVHNWLGGARVASVHLVRLAAIEALVERFAGVPPSDVRARMLQPSADGLTELDRISRAARPGRRVPTSPLTLADMVAPLAAAEVQPVRKRKSALQAGAVRNRSTPQP